MDPVTNPTPETTTPGTAAVPPVTNPVVPPAPAGTPPPARKPRAPSAPQPLRLVRVMPGGYSVGNVQPPDTVTEKVELAKWLKDQKPGAIPAGEYRLIRDMGPVKIGVVSEPKTTVSIG